VAAVCRLIDVHRGRLRGGPINLITGAWAEANKSRWEEYIIWVCVVGTIRQHLYTCTRRNESGKKKTRKTATEIIRGVHCSRATGQKPIERKGENGRSGVGSKHKKTRREECI